MIPHLTLLSMDLKDWWEVLVWTKVHLREFPVLWSHPLKSFKAANMYLLFKWMAWNTNLVEYHNWRRNVEQVTILWGGPGVQQSSACVSRCICLFLSMFGEPYPLARYPHILLYDFPGNYLSHPRQKETSKHCCLSPPHVIINQSELKSMPTAMIYEYITGLIGIL